ncbi:hypothetical protein, partial [Dolosigranulum pigrum]|uniref:hypothetical protein n=1 Tax=Dolosigranulum pigrum TaxID=29394 RepID=UPI001C65AF38
TWEVYQCFMRAVDQRDGVAMSTLIHTNWCCRIILNKRLSKYNIAKLITFILAFRYFIDEPS